jgi:hypothetical protein
MSGGEGRGGRRTERRHEERGIGFWRTCHGFQMVLERLEPFGLLRLADGQDTCRADGFDFGHHG